MLTNFLSLLTLNYKFLFYSPISCPSNNFCCSISINSCIFPLTSMKFNACEAKYPCFCACSFAHPSVIRFPFEKTAFYNNQATMIRVNERFYQLPQEMKDKGIAVQANAIDFVRQLKEA